MEDKRQADASDRRASRRGGRRTIDQPKPWYMRRRLWLAVASVAFVGWKRLTHVAKPGGDRAKAA
ncbi:MAG: hypothetical protein AB7P99_05740 [Vicinamibacterales bacterium]